MPLRPGDEAPDFTLTDADGREVSLSDFRGQPVIIYFYPKDDTPGCTTQACDIRDSWAEFEQFGAAVLGISPDSERSHQRFRAKYDLPHTLLSDPDHTVLIAYGAWGPRTAYGRTFDGVTRSTVLVAPDGKVAAVWPKVKASQHAEQVLTALRELQAA